MEILDVVSSTRTVTEANKATVRGLMKLLSSESMAVDLFGAQEMR